ncbi:unnamed protein product [Medioppia subpectinata]|uniref:F-box domain-containing protein n=1 Tax=Medioppia subpectinata TaxID=1979941 RepID=A0A7R9PXV9_9ACAR|nr:unnamed protein product [Medioppia subpectinata]CAG2105220.1 unnamed protein product [Medioppia subpectinata]
MSSALTLDTLCDDVLLTIFGQYLDLRSQLRVQRVCKRFNHIIDDVFAGRGALVLSDRHFGTNCYDQNVGHYWQQSVQTLSEARDGLWMRTTRGLKLMAPIDIQMLCLKRYPNLKELCLVVNNSTNLSLLDLIAANCGPNVHKLILIAGGHKLSFTDKSVDHFCDRFTQLTHFELNVCSIAATKECFHKLLNRFQRLDVLKIRAQHLFTHSQTQDEYCLTDECFAQLSHRLTTIDVSNVVLNSQSIQSLAQKGCLRSVKHLGVYKLIPNSMQVICNHLSGLESLSFSMNAGLDVRNTRRMIGFVTQLTDLKTLKIVWFGRDVGHNSPEVCRTTLNALKNCHNLKTFGIQEAVINRQSMDDMCVCLPVTTTLELMNCSLNETTFQTIDRWLQLKQLIVRNDYKRVVFGMDSTNARLADDMTETCLEMGLIDRPIEAMAAANADAVPVIGVQNHNGLELFDDFFGAHIANGFHNVVNGFMQFDDNEELIDFVVYEQ